MADPVQRRPDRLDALASALWNIAQAEGGALFMHWPDRWYEGPHGGRLVRCTGGHVSSCALRTERGDVCLARVEVDGIGAMCGAPVWLTFPEDRDGPLVAPEVCRG